MDFCKTNPVNAVVKESLTFIKRGRIFYYQEDLDKWLNAKGRFTATAQAFQSKEENYAL